MSLRFICLARAGHRGLDRQIVGTLQELMRTESNTYVRQRSQHVLEAINASAEIY